MQAQRSLAAAHGGREASGNCLHAFFNNSHTMGVFRAPLGGRLFSPPQTPPLEPMPPQNADRQLSSSTSVAQTLLCDHGVGPTKLRVSTVRPDGVGQISFLSSTGSDKALQGIDFKAIGTSSSVSDAAWNYLKEWLEHVDGVALNSTLSVLERQRIMTSFERVRILTASKGYSDFLSTG